MRVDELKVAGMHNAVNALAALALDAVGLGCHRCSRACELFGLPHRLAKVSDVRGVSFYDDSKGTNVGSTELRWTA